MKTKLHSLFIVLALLAAVHQAAAQGTRFFRISGPAATTLTAFRPDGTLVWSNALAGTNYTVQTVSALPGGTNWVDYVQLPVTNGVNTNLLIAFNPPAGMALIPAGSFTMGNCMDPNEGDSDELPLHTVYVSAFYMDKYDVTKTLWTNVYQWATNHGYSFDHADSGKAANHPVWTIDWYDCVKWCNARSEQAGKTPAYYTSAAQTTVYRSGQVDLTNACVNWSGGYRLPTEAEWEKAARGGLSGQRFPWGNTISWSQANYYADPLSAGGYAYDVNPTNGFHPTFNDGVSPYTSPVDYFAPNGYGLYDMAGNVWQWCWDRYGAYSSGSQTDPRGPASGSGRVFRGGDWYYNAFRCRAADRNDGINPAGSPTGGSGFRSVLSPGQ
jgi:formylglycine-generating enzyme required for sulfatase activity